MVNLGAVQAGQAGVSTYLLLGLGFIPRLSSRQLHDGEVLAIPPGLYLDGLISTGGILLGFVFELWIDKGGTFSFGGRYG
jgi:hypothetical protein